MYVSDYLNTFKYVQDNILSGKYDIPEHSDNKVVKHINGKFISDLKSAIQKESLGIVSSKYAENIVQFIRETMPLDDMSTTGYKQHMLRRVIKLINIIENKI